MRTKAYVISFSEALADEVAGTGVTVTCLCPGPTATEFSQVAEMEHSRLFRCRPMTAEQVARIGYRGVSPGESCWRWRAGRTGWARWARGSCRGAFRGGSRSGSMGRSRFGPMECGNSLPLSGRLAALFESGQRPQSGDQSPHSKGPTSLVPAACSAHRRGRRASRCGRGRGHGRDRARARPWAAPSS